MTDAASVYVFEDHEGEAVPLMRRDAKGQLRTIDNKRFFGIDTAPAHFNRPAAKLELLWQKTMEDIYTGADDAVADAADPGKPASNTPAAAERFRALRKEMFGEMSDDQFGAFIEMCRIRRLNPWARQVWPKLVPNRKSGEVRVVPMVSIDGLRLLADRSGDYAGSDEARFEYNQAEALVRASVTVWKMNGSVKCSFSASAEWREYYPSEGSTEFWDRMPHLMLAKVAEAMALRKAFPNDCAGLYTPEEMEQAVGSRREHADDRQDYGRQPAIPVVADPSAPPNFAAFGAALEARGFQTAFQKSEVIGKYRTRLRTMADANPRGFWKAILADLDGESAKAAAS